MLGVKVDEDTDEPFVSVCACFLTAYRLRQNETSLECRNVCLRAQQLEV